MPFFKIALDLLNISSSKSNYTIAYNNGWAAIDFTVKITENLIASAAASGVTIVGFRLS